MAYTLPDLDYDYSALAPAIMPEIMELHHSKHHANYVNTANETAEQIADARAKGDFGALAGLERKYAFNFGGHINHSIFWKNMTPGGATLAGALKAQIDTDFGSFENFQKQFEATANTIFGSGWAMLVWDPLAGKLQTVQVYDQQGNCPIGLTPIVVLDMWEHAFYLQYKNVKADYVKQWWNVVNWDDASARFTTAQAHIAV
ncbi:MAG: superoxide dismutase [Propionibacteriaceae bacterium]